jgi:hypothetical protein
MSDDYQAIYDAVRSRISNGDVGAAIERVAGEAFDIGWQKQHAQQEIYAVSHEWQRPSVLFRPTVSLDGNAYCVLYGEDLMAGCAGFGSTLAEAMADFDKNWFSQKAPAQVGRNAKRQDPQGLGPKDEHAVPPEEAGCAQPSPSQPPS